MKPQSPLSRITTIENRIPIRGQRVILDFDLAELYGVTTTRLNQQVNRNLKGFRLDFMFGLTKQKFSVFDVAICNIKRKRKDRDFFRWMIPITL